MKKIDLNKVAKRFFLGNMIAAALFFSMQASATKANTTNYNNEGERIVDPARPNKFEVKYLGLQKNNFEFDVHYNNLKGGTFTFVAKDEDGDILFEKEYNNKQFHKKVELPRGFDLNKISFSIVSFDDKFIQTKEIIIKTNYIEDVLVKIN